MASESLLSKKIRARFRGRKRPRGRPSRLRGLLVKSPVELGDLVHPALSLAVFEREYLVARPVEVKGYVRYLLIEPL